MLVFGIILFLVILHLLVRSTDEKTTTVKVPVAVVLSIVAEASASLPSDNKP